MCHIPKKQIFVYLYTQLGLMKQSRHDVNVFPLLVLSFYFNYGTSYSTMLLQNIRYEFIIVHSRQSSLAAKSRVYSPKFRSMCSFYTSVRCFTLLCLMYMMGIFMNYDFLQRRSTNPFVIYILILCLSTI